MGKKIILSIWILSIFLVGTVYSNDKLKNVQIHQAGDGLIFYTDRELYQCYLTKQELYNLKYIYSDVIKINKCDYEVYWKNNYEIH